MEGKIIWYDYRKQFGFILGNDGQEYFVHANLLSSVSDAYLLRKGQPVRFTPVDATPNPKAQDVQVIAGAEEIIEDDTPKRLKRNPFTPQDPVTDPRKFAGRREILRSAVDSLYNFKNLLITGPRGIGKSSLAYQLLYMTQGEDALLNRLQIDLDDFSFGYLSGDHRCSQDNSLSDIARGLLVNLAKHGGASLLAEESKTSEGFDLKFFKSIKETKANPVTASDAANYFVSEVDRIFRTRSEPQSGISFLIDEVDALSENVPLGQFLKATVEKFRLDNYFSVSFIVSGVTSTATSLLAQHPSSSRLFERIELERMANEELQEVVQLTLEGTGIGITNRATGRMVALANSFPQPLHLLGYHAFRLDTDGTIDTDDLEEAKKYIVRMALRQDYEEKLRGIGGPNIRDIIRVCSSASRGTMTLDYLRENLPNLTEHALQSHMGELVKKDILEKHGRYVYSFREPLFQIYCSWVLGGEAL